MVGQDNSSQWAGRSYIIDLQGLDLHPQGRDLAHLAQRGQVRAAGEDIIIVLFDVVEDALVEHGRGADGELTFTIDFFRAALFLWIALCAAALSIVEVSFLAV